MSCKCGNETTAGVWLCGPCADSFEVRLGEVAGVVEQVQQVIPRLTLTATYGERMGGSKAQHAPAPVSMDAVSSLDELQRFLLNTALRVATLKNPLPGRSSGIVADYLATNMHRIRTLTNAHELHKHLDKLLTECERAADAGNNQPRIILGPCETIGCEQTLTAHENDYEARCPVCTLTIPIHEYRTNRTRQALGHDNTPIRAAQAVRLLRSKGVNVTTKDIENWVAWGHLTEIARDDKGRRLYNLQHIYTQAAKKAA